MLERFIVFILCFTSLVVQAESRCGVLLSSSALTSSSNISAEKLSPSAQAYVNLIQLYIKQASAQFDNNLIQAAIASDSYINPFQSRKDSLSLQFSTGIESLRGRIEDSDWAQVKKSLVRLVKQQSNTKADQEKKSEETAKVFYPSVLNKQNISTGVFRQPAIITVKKKSFVAFAGLTGEFGLYEFLNDKMVLVDSFELESGVQSSPLWITFKGQVLLALNTSDGGLHIYELRNKKLIHRSFEKVGSDNFSSPAWQIVDGRLFLTSGRKNKLHLFEWDGKRIISHSYAAVVGDIQSAPAWHVVDNRVYLSFGTSALNLYLYELKDNKLRRRDSQIVSGQVYTPPAWKDVNGSTFLCIGISEYLNLYKFDSGKLQPRAHQKTGGLIFAAVDWVEDSGQVFVAAVASGGEVSIHELVDNELVFADKASIGQFGEDGHLGWQKIGNQIFLAVSMTESVHFFELIGRRLSTIGVLKLDKEITSIVSWAVINGNTRLVVTTASQAAYLIKLDKEIKKQGGRK